MPDVTLTIRGDQIGSYTSVSGSGNNADRVVTLTGVEALGTAADTFTVLIEQVNTGQVEFQNGQFVTVFDADGNEVVPRTVVQPDREQGQASGDEHLILFQNDFVIDLGGVPAGPTTVQYTEADQAADPGDDDDDGNLDFDAFPCFAAGTMIATPDGQRLAEDLRSGDAVLCADGSTQKILWVGIRTLSLHRDDLRQHPIKFRADMLGMATADLVVSPQHCILLNGPIVAKQFGTDHVLAPARGLLSLPGVRLMQGKKSITYVSVLLQKHAVIWANGVACESLYPGPQAMHTLEPVQRDAIVQAVPGISEHGVAAYGPRAAQHLRVQQARGLAQRMKDTQSWPQLMLDKTPAGAVPKIG